MLANAAFDKRRDEDGRTYIVGCCLVLSMALVNGADPF